MPTPSPNEDDLQPNGGANHTKVPTRIFQGKNLLLVFCPQN